MLKNSIFQRLIVALLICWSFSSFAARDADPIYQFEIIIFSHLSNDGLRSEYWPPVRSETLPSNTVELTGDQIIPRSQWQLKNEEQLLQRSHSLILLHLAWQESAAELKRGHSIHLTNSENNSLGSVDGTVTIDLARYFDVRFNLQCLVTWETIAELKLTNITHNDDDPYAAFKINTRLRMRSGELNYIDHPLYGILIKITPITPPDV